MRHMFHVTLLTFKEILAASSLLIMAQEDTFINLLITLAANI